LNYDNPLNSERRRYVLVGASEIDALSAQHEWDGMDPDRASRYGTLVWNRFITHGYGEGRGARLPYERYLQKGSDPSGILVEVPKDLARHYKYVCRSFTDDEAAIFLRELLARLEHGKAEKVVDWEWDRQIDWINKALDSVWKDRGLFPGLGPVLEALGFQRATMYVERNILNKGVQDPRRHVLERLAAPKKAEDAAATKSYETVAKTLRLLPDAVRELAFDRLALFELTTEQVQRIIGSGVIADEEREKVGLRSDAAAVIDNPYLIIEEYQPLDEDDRIPFHRIDHGIFLARARGGSTVPGIEDFAPDDHRRLRAAAITRLRGATADGHSFLPQEELLAGLARLELPGLTKAVGAVSFARELEFHEQRMTVTKEGALTAWQLKEIAEDEEVMRERVKKLRDRKALDPKIKNWEHFLPPPLPSAPPRVAALLAEARKSQAQVLERLAQQPLSILTGGAGTGKTTVIGALIKALSEAKLGEKFVLLTPTGKAAVRLRRKIMEVSGLDLEPRTIHSYLWKSWIDAETWRPLREGVPITDGATTVVIDESSMLDLTMLATVFRALDWSHVRRLILCGDPQQLPPIGVGSPFKNIVDAVTADSANRACALTVNCRQVQQDSAALRLAEQFAGPGSPEVADELLDQIRVGGRINPDLEVRFFENEHDLPEQLEKLVGDALGELLRIEKLDPSVDMKQPWLAYDRLHRYGGHIEEMRLDALEVLSPYRGGYFGADEINLRLQALLRGKLMSGRRVRLLGKQSGRRYVFGDKVMQVQNQRRAARTKIAWDDQLEKNVDLYVANGELGRMMTVDGQGRDKFGRVRFETTPGVTVKVDGEWAETMLDLGYAMSVHKSQGSDFGGVVVVVPKEEQQRLMSRELLYTALTRFTNRLYLLIQGKPGDIGALLRGLWLGSSDHLRRNTSLYGLRQAIADLDNFRPEQRIHRTLRDELVRSKSEALIATQLHHAKIGYYYELPLIAPDGTVRRPDFTIPVETPDGPAVFYWEHWGMRGDPAYDASIKRRQDWYAKHGFAAQLIESDEVGGFDQKRIARIIADRLQP
jgi:ATP-dependent exoDNAse (exonuclease V) alpha subunit